MVGEPKQNWMLFHLWAKTNMVISMWGIPKPDFSRNSGLVPVYFGIYQKLMNWRQDTDCCNFLKPHISLQDRQANTSVIGGSISGSTLFRVKTVPRQVPIFRQGIISVVRRISSAYKCLPAFLQTKKPVIFNPNCSILTGQE